MNDLDDHGVLEMGYFRAAGLYTSCKHRLDDCRLDDINTGQNFLDSMGWLNRTLTYVAGVVPDGPVRRL